MDILEASTGNKMKYKFSDWRPSDQKVYISEISNVSKELGWAPKTTPERGIELLVDWVKKNKELF
jgi:CDP-paratose 2-epimerase